MQINGTLEYYIKSEILPRLASPPFGAIHATQVSHSRPVFIYREDYNKLSVVGKYFKYDNIDAESAWSRAEREFHNLTVLRDQVGMKGDHYNVIAPLGRNKVLSALLVLETAPGKTLDHYIKRSIYENRGKELFFKLSDLSRFFARLHTNSNSGKPVPTNLPMWYMDTLINNLNLNFPGFKNHESEIRELANRWWNRDWIFRDSEVIVHGDATPTNFLFHEDKVTAIDLEKMKMADRCWDLGFMAAELKHHHMWRTGDGSKAEPFIGHFLWEYSKSYGNTNIFYEITKKLPLYISLGLLRIARNTYLDDKYRNILIGEAKICLKYRP